MSRTKARVTLAVLAAVVFCGGAAQAECIEARAVDPADFVPVIDNPWSPMVPGTTFVCQAETEDELIWNEITVTYDTREVAGVTCTVVYDVEWVCEGDGCSWVTSEETWDWYAQDVLGNVWYFGEETCEYLYDENGDFIGFSTEGSWEAGVDDAVPGIVMLADPAPGVCYSQEYYEGEAEDFGKVLRLNADVELEELAEFEDCLVTKEWTPLDPGVVEHKYYAWGVGLVYIEELKGKTAKVELVDVMTF